MDTVAERMSGFLERRATACLAVFSALYLLVTIPQAQRHLWYDELFTWHMSQLPSMAAVWQALKEGVDLNPPLFYVATRAAQSVFGSGPAATRAPAILGFLVLLLCLYRFTSRRVGRAYGFAALLLPLLTGAYTYASEARAYGLELGFVGLALLAWQRAIEPDRPWWTLPALTLSLAAALLTHCYAVLVLVPLGLAELARSIERRRIDLPLWLGYAALAPIGLIYLPLMAAMRPYKLTNELFQPNVLLVPKFYGQLFSRVVWPVLGLSFLGARTKSGGKTGGVKAPWTEWVLAVALLITPLTAYGLAAGVTGVYMFRYTLIAVIGASILLTYYVADRVPAGAVVAIFGVAIAAFSWGAIAAAHDEIKPAVQLEKTTAGLPIVVSNGLLFLEADQYETAPVATRLRYLSDEAAGLHYTGSNVFDYGYPLLQRWFHLRGRVESLREFERQNPRFLLYGTPTHPTDWLIRKLVAEGADLELLQSGSSFYGDTALFAVTLHETN